MVNMCTRPIWTPKQEDHHHGEYVHPPNLDLKQEDIHQGEYVQRNLDLKQEDHHIVKISTWTQNKRIFTMVNMFDLDLKQRNLQHGLYVKCAPYIFDKIQNIHNMLVCPKWIL